ncbi:hypothetical protein MMC11_003100 [Xylographa trunciseda]|nr:hypothetical protein [Xylographa trunciseda]
MFQVTFHHHTLSTIAHACHEAAIYADLQASCSSATAVGFTSKHLRYVIARQLISSITAKGLTSRLATRRRSSRLESRQRSVSIPHILGSYYESQSPFEQRATDLRPPQLVKASSYTRVPTSDPIEASALVPSTEQLQGCPCPSQADTHRTRKRRADISLETGAKGPLKRARLTEKNLEAFEKMGGRQRKNAGKKKFLDRPRESEPPELLDYQRYLVVTEDYENELGVEISAYPLLAKRTSREVEISGYFQRPNHAWSAVDNHLTTGLSDPQPDLVESYRKTDYPPQAVEALSADLAPSSYNEAMPAYAVEFKSSNGDMKEAKLQCAFDGSIMTEGARGAHTYMDKSDDDFYGKTQALTVAFNGGLIEYYDLTVLSNDFNDVYDDKDPISAQQPTGSLIPVSSVPLDGYNYDAYNDEVDPTYQLLKESWTDNGYASPDTQIYNPITPPQSSKDVTVLLESQQLSVPTVTEPGGNIDLNVRGHRKTRARTRQAIAVEGPRDVDYKPKSRKARTKY